MTISQTTSTLLTLNVNLALGTELGTKALAPRAAEKASKVQTLISTQNPTTSTCDFLKVEAQNKHKEASEDVKIVLPGLPEFALSRLPNFFFVATVPHQNIPHVNNPAEGSSEKEP
jgi:hypothetical protein